MAGGIDWFRWHHGSVTDPKFQLVARQAGASLPDVLAVWAYLLEHASAASDRGTFAEIDCEAVDCMFGFPSTETRTADIMASMIKRGLHDGTRITAWEKRQPKRERDPASPAPDATPPLTSTERSRAHRSKKSQVTPEESVQRHATPCNATVGHETPREEESREEKREDHSDPDGSVPGTLPGSPVPKPKAARKRKAADTSAPTAAAWDAYSKAYAGRYGVAPLRNASVNGKLAQFIAKLPAAEAPEVARYFISHEGNLYVAAMHPVDLLLRDAEKLRTEWLTNRGVQKARPSETSWQQSQRERVERFTGGLVSAKAPGQTMPMEILDAIAPETH